MNVEVAGHYADTVADAVQWPGISPEPDSIASVSNFLRHYEGERVA